MVAPDHIAEEADGDHAAVNDFHAKERLAHRGHQDVRNDSHRGDNGDVHLGMPEEPEKMLPQKWRAAGVRLKVIADHQASRDEKTSTGDAIKNQ